MEIQDMNILLSPYDVQFALFGAAIVEQQHPGFTNYMQLLRLRVDTMVPPNTNIHELAEDLKNRIPSISIPYTKPMVEMLADAIQEGMSQTEIDVELLDGVKDTFVELSAINAARYASEARNNKKRNFKLIQGGKNKHSD